MSNSPVLAVVIPVYNEQENLIPLLTDWLLIFQQTAVPYRVILIDDGSTDQSLQVLLELQKSDPKLEVITQANAGHGAAILRGYRLAVDAGAGWVFQIDSDHQLDTAAFRELWSNRERYDLLLAERIDKDASPGRLLISRISRVMVHGLFGRNLRDVNSPYRLMRTESLRGAIFKIPSRSFAPNILITAWFVLKKRRIFMTETRPRGGAGRRRSRLNAYFLRGAVRSAFQTLVFRIRC